MRRAVEFRSESLDEQRFLGKETAAIVVLAYDSEIGSVDAMPCLFDVLGERRCEILVDNFVFFLVTIRVAVILASDSLLGLGIRTTEDRTEHVLRCAMFDHSYC